MAEPKLKPAYYAADSVGGWRDWWLVLHPPYTAWHLAYVVIGASLAPHVQLSRLVATLLAFLLAVGFAAHALDELHGRPLGTHIPSASLQACSRPLSRSGSWGPWFWEWRASFAWGSACYRSSQSG